MPRCRLGQSGSLLSRATESRFKPSGLQSLAPRVLRYRPSLLGQATCQIEFEPQQSSCSTRYRVSCRLEGKAEPANPTRSYSHKLYKAQPDFVPTAAQFHRSQSSSCLGCVPHCGNKRPANQASGHAELENGEIGRGVALEPAWVLPGDGSEAVTLTLPKRAC
jgi:hypothetical protein